MNLELGKEIIGQIGKQNKINFHFLASMVDEYESDHILKKLNQGMKKADHQKDLLKYERKLIFKGALDYINTPIDILNVCLTKKSIKETFMHKLYKKVLY